MNLLTIKGFSKAYTDKILFDDADFSVNSGEKIGVIGVNGTGKSTLLKIIAGIDECDSGQLSKGNNVVIKYLPQTPTSQRRSAYTTMSSLQMSTRRTNGA